MNSESKAIEVLEMSSEDLADVLFIGQENNLSQWSLESYLSEIKNTDSIALTMKYRGKLAGFIVARLIISKLYIKHPTEYETEILNIAIAKPLQNRGFGQILLDKFLKIIEDRNVSEIWLEVRITNLKAIKFYEKNGFSRQTERKNYYSDPIENAVIMKKTVDFSKRSAA